MPLKNLLKLIFAGVCGAIIINILFSAFIREIVGYLAAILSAIFMATICVIWIKEKRLGKWHKLRLLSFGISSGSFVFALYDVIKFVSTYGPNSILVYNGPPYLTIGGISFFSILFSFAIGGFFSVVAGIPDLEREKDTRAR